MFFTFDNHKFFFVLTNGKSPEQIFNELFLRMDKTFISNKEKQLMLVSIRQQMGNK